MKTLPYILIDVFTKEKFGGNPLAIFYDAPPELTTSFMQTIAKELNFSETTFVFPPDNPANKKKVRIYTPQMELPMAGHPTVGTAFVLAGRSIVSVKEGRNNWVFEQGVGDISVIVHVEHGKVVQVEMNQPVPRFGELFTNMQAVADLLSLQKEDFVSYLPVQSVSSGVPYLYIPVKSLDAMSRINFRMDVWRKIFSQHEHTRHVYIFTTETEKRGSHVHSRMFAPAMGILEDPATGGAGGPLGAYLVEYNVITRHENGLFTIINEQGFEMGRPSYIEVKVKKTEGEIREVSVCGTAVEVGKGDITI